MSTPTARSYPKRSRQSTGTTTLNARRGGRPRRSDNNNNNHDENHENEINHDYDFENTGDGDHQDVMIRSGGGGDSSTLFVSSSTTTTTFHTFLPKRRKTGTTTSTSSSTNQRWVKVHRRPMAPTNEPYFGSSPFASFTVPTWVKLQDLTKEERAVYDAKIDEETKKKMNSDNKDDDNKTIKSQAGERKDSSRDGGVMEVGVPSASEITVLGQGESHSHEKEGENLEAPSATNVDLLAKNTIPAAPTSDAGATVIEGTHNPLMTMNSEDLKEEDKVKQECGKGNDAVMEVPIDSSLAMLRKDADVGDNNHAHEAEIIGSDNVEINEDEDQYDDEEGEIEEDCKEAN